MTATDDLRALDLAVSEIMGEATTQEQHGPMYDGMCLFCCGTDYGPGGLPAECRRAQHRVTPWASAEPGSEQADILAGKLERYLVARGCEPLIWLTRDDKVIVAIKHSKSGISVASLNEALARAVLLAAEGEAQR
jgi:hypothetical protein